MTDLCIQELIRAIEQADSPVRLVSAVRALAAARLEAGIPTLIHVLGYNNPGAAVAAVEGLVQMGELAVEPLLEQLDGYNYGARAYAIRALAAIGDSRSLDVLKVAAETDFAPSVRRAATKGLGYIRWQSLAYEQRATAQEQALNALLTVSQDSDWAIRYAAVVGLQALAQSTTECAELPLDQRATLLHAVVTRLEDMAQIDPDRSTQARACYAHQSLQPVQQSLMALHH